MTGTKIDDSMSWLGGHLKLFKSDPLEFLMTLNREKGDIAPFRLGPQQFYLITHPDLVKQVLLNKEDAFVKSKNFKQLKPFIGEGLLTSEGDFHKKQRRMIQPLFRPGEIEKYGNDIVSLTSTYSNGFKPGQSRLISRDMMNITLAVITKTMFNMKLFETHDTVGKPIDIAMEIVSKRIRSLFRIPLSIPTKDNREFNHSVKVLDSVVLAMIDYRRKHPEEVRDLLSTLMEARDDENQGMSDQQLRDEAMTIFLAGHETTANALTWAFYLLAKHPEKLEKMLSEQDNHLNGRLPNESDVQHLPYTTNIIRETLRLYPPAWMFGRDLTKPISIGTQYLNKEESVMLSPYVMHRNHHYFPAPDVFLPERFENDLLKDIPTHAYIPFGGGARVCIGNHFAMMEAILIMVTISQRFTFSITQEQPQATPDPLITLRPKNGLLLKANQR